ncbi:MAG: alpha/beta hydrolase [Rhodobacteraceae bacterium]|nr:alpha/beta hydrolase [Paracoccaceae bacterium]
MTENIDIDSEGAILSVQVTGEGPLLVMIPGGGGTGGRYARVAVHLAGHWTVATYDRRCCGASTGDRTAPFSMDQQARDAAAVIRGLGYERADVFGNSGGANIALALASAFPARIARLVVHEPPLTPLLPDAADWGAYSDRIVAAFRAGDPRAAFGLFLSEIRGLQGPPPGPPPEPRDMAFFLGHELTPISRYAPDPANLRGLRMVAAYGEGSTGAYYARTAEILSEQAQCPLVRFAGHHFSFADTPEAFASDLVAAFDRAG